MSETLLRTKLFVPPVRPNLVPREQLLERLNQGLDLAHKLTLISAPAGCGKTTLVTAWAADCGRAVAWLSLDEGDAQAALAVLAPVRELMVSLNTMRTHTKNIYSKLGVNNPI